MTIEDRFWIKVNKTDTCWLWVASINDEGYGRFFLNGKRVPAHRIAFQMSIGLIPTGLIVCHTCDVCNCVRPEHLFLGTDLDNAQDCINKGRKAVLKRENNPAAKLNSQQVDEIRKKYVKGIVRYIDLAAEYGVHKSMIGYIIRGVNWK